MKTALLTPFSQVPFAEAIKKSYPDIILGAVEMMTTPQQANDCWRRTSGPRAARHEFLRDPHVAYG